MKKSRLSRCFLSFVVFAVSFAAISAETYEPPCDGDLDLVYDPCGSSCERTCENIADPNWKCTPNCTIGGCRCAKGLIRNYGWICVKPEDCNVQCPEGEAYSNCGANSCQNTCAELTKMLTCTAPCTPGCVCVLGYVRDENGVCIPAETCGVSCGGDKNAFTTTCGNDCSRRNCTVLNDEPFYCSTECSGIAECNCKPGYVTHGGKCIPISKCPACPGENESYLNRPCDLNCADLTERCEATKPGKSGCFCNIGYARNYKNVCVRLDKCPQKSCGGDFNAIFDQCDLDCQKTCELKNGNPDCIRGCTRKGDCVCREGFLKNSAGKCVPPEECSLMQRSNLRANKAICLEHEIYCDCANCQPTCAAPDVDPKCSCQPGCKCDLGLLRNSTGSCVPPSQCDSPCNGDLDKVFSATGYSCARTCENIKDPSWKCAPNATETGACVCRDGLVLNYGGHCVKPEDCYKESPEDEVFSNCGANKCQNTCKNPDKRKTCTDECRSGFVCIEGYVRDANGVCIPNNLCDVSCGGDNNAQSTKCANACSRRTCAIINDEPFYCSPDCDGIETCICKPGYVTQDGKCIPIKNCPICPGKHESYLNRPCDLDCSNLTEKCNDPTKPSKEGCFCNIGFARDYKGVCVRLPDCPQKSCDGDCHAFYDQCDVTCQKTCEKLNGNTDCIPGCSRQGGCVCRPGFVKNKFDVCVAPEECNLQQRTVKKLKNDKNCGENEVKSACANCEKTCSVRDADPTCVCKPGFACKPGYLRNSKGDCVTKDTCDSPCGGDYDKIFDVCGNSCQRTCENINDNNWTCTPKCTENGGCKCNDGLVLNSAGFCVLPKDCSQKCPEGEAYSQSGNNNCQNTCDDPKKSENCFPIAKPGCVCLPGYVRDCNGVCIPADQCGKSCGGDSNSVSTTCATPCSFRNCGSINDEPMVCAQVCNGIETCVCKSGYVTREGKCTPISQCPKCDQPNESLLVRPCDLNCYSLDEKCDSLKSCKEGCFCNIGYARDHKNNCVRLTKCPQKQCNGDLNAIFDQIGLNCMKTCDDKEGNPNCVPMIMRSGGCSCREGFVKNYDGKCIPPQECCLTPKSNMPRPPGFPQFNPTATTTNSQNKLVSYPSEHLNPLNVAETTTAKSTYTPYPTIPPTTTTTPPPTTTSCTTKPAKKTRASTTATTPAPTTTTTATTTTAAPTTTPRPTKKKRSPKPPEPESSECGENEMLEQMPMKCTPSVQTCEMYFKGEQPMCMLDIQNCKPECRCLGGYVRNKNWKCVTPQNCCDDPNSEMRAGANQCPGGTCSQPEFSNCDAPWVPFGCQCKMGYLKKSDTDSTCVPISECHKYKTCD